MRPQLMIQVVDVPPDIFERRMLAGRERCIALTFQLADFCFDASLVDADDRVMLAGVDAQRLT